MPESNKTDTDKETGQNTESPVKKSGILEGLKGLFRLSGGEVSQVESPEDLYCKTTREWELLKEKLDLKCGSLEELETELRKTRSLLKRPEGKKRKRKKSKIAESAPVDKLSRAEIEDRVKEIQSSIDEESRVIEDLQLELNSLEAEKLILENRIEFERIEKQVFKSKDRVGGLLDCVNRCQKASRYSVEKARDIFNRFERVIVEKEKKSFHLHHRLDRLKTKDLTDLDSQSLIELSEWCQALERIMEETREEMDDALAKLDTEIAKLEEVVDTWKERETLSRESENLDLVAQSRLQKNSAETNLLGLMHHRSGLLMDKERLEKSFSDLNEFKSNVESELEKKSESKS